MKTTRDTNQIISSETEAIRSRIYLIRARQVMLDKDTDTVGLHILNLYKEGKLSREGPRVRRDVNFYNLDVITSVGYRIKSKRTTQFRQWATRVLQGHLERGFTLNEKRVAPVVGYGHGGRSNRTNGQHRTSNVQRRMNQQPT